MTGQDQDQDLSAPLSKEEIEEANILERLGSIPYGAAFPPSPSAWSPEQIRRAIYNNRRKLARELAPTERAAHLLMTGIRAGSIFPSSLSHGEIALLREYAPVPFLITYGLATPEQVELVVLRRDQEETERVREDARQAAEELEAWEAKGFSDGRPQGRERMEAEELAHLISRVLTPDRVIIQDKQGRKVTAEIRNPLGFRLEHTDVDAHNRITSDLYARIDRYMAEQMIGPYRHAAEPEEPGEPEEGEPIESYEIPPPRSYAASFNRGKIAGIGTAIQSLPIPKQAWDLSFSPAGPYGRMPGGLVRRLVVEGIVTVGDLLRFIKDSDSLNYEMENRQGRAESERLAVRWGLKEIGPVRKKQIRDFIATLPDRELWEPWLNYPHLWDDWDSAQKQLI